MNNILVTGANGFIGSHIVKKFLNSGDKVTGLVRESSDLSLIENLDIELKNGDISDQESIRNAFQNVDIVIHVAGFASDWGPFEKFHEINVLGTKNVAMAASEANVKRFVQISSVSIHGFGAKNVNENDPLPESMFAYVETKRQAELFLFEYGKNVKMEITAIRPGNVFGPDDHTFIDKYLQAICTGKIAYVNSGKAYTCPTYITNLCEAVYLAAFSPQAPGEAFLITDGLDITWKEFTSDLANALGAKSPSLSFPYGFVYPLAALTELLFFQAKSAPLLTRYRIKNGGLDYHFDISKAKNVLGFVPPVKYERAIEETVHWYKEKYGC